MKARWLGALLLLPALGWDARSAAPQTPQDLLPGVAIRRATQVPLAAGGASATFGPGGDRAAFVCDPVDAGGRPQLRLVEATTGRIIAKSLVPAFRDARCPTLSPDGRELLFVGVHQDAPDEEDGVIRTDLDGERPVRLTPKDVPAVAAAWSRDGRRIAYVQRRVVFDPEAGAPKDEYRVLLAWADPRLGPVEELDLDVGPGPLAFSPDGQWLACSAPDGELAVTDPEAKRKRLHRLFDAQTAALGFRPGAQVRLVNYVWLPDSQRLLLSIAPDDTPTDCRTWLLHLSGDRHELTRGRVVGNTPDARSLFLEKDGTCWRLDLP